MILKNFLTESLRSLKLIITLALCSFLLGFAGSTSLRLKNYIQNLFSPTDWGADLVILPKSVTPEGLSRSLLSGKAEGLIPLALFKTLQSQIVDEQRRNNLPETSLRILGFIPHDNTVAVFGDRQRFFRNEQSIWSKMNLTDYSAENAGAEDKIPEWGSEVLMGILVKGDLESLVKLKQMIDRRTVAQAWLLKPGTTADDQKRQQLETALSALTVLLFLCLIPGLILSFVILRIRQKSIFLVLNEIGRSKASQLKFAVLQVIVLIVIPFAMGIFASPLFVDTVVKKWIIL